MTESNEKISREKLLLACRIVEVDLATLKDKIERTEILNLDILKSLKNSELGLLVESYVPGYVESDYLIKLSLACQTIEEKLKLLKYELQDLSISDEEMEKIIKGSRLGLIVTLKLPIVEKQLYAEGLRAKRMVKNNKN